MQAVLSYEERLQRLRKELREESDKHGVTCSHLLFWESRPKELEARLQVYEGKQGGEDLKSGATGGACDGLGTHGSPVRPGCDGGVQDDRSGVWEGPPAREVPPGCGEPKELKQFAVHHVAIIGQPSPSGGTTADVDCHEGVRTKNVV